MFRNVTQEQRKQIESALAEVGQIPQMQEVLNNLPGNITFSVSDDMNYPARYSARHNVIELNLRYFENQSSGAQLDFLLSLSHELRHASQERMGLYYTEVQNPSFADTFRVAKLSEMEAHLFDSVLETEFLKQERFQGLLPTLPTQYYQTRLAQYQQTNPNQAEALARADFLTTYWQKGRVDGLSNEMYQHVDSYYKYYNRQAFRHAQLAHNPRLNKHSPGLDGVMRAATEMERMYQERMGVTGVLPSGYFLTDKVDYIHAGTYEEGIDFLDAHQNRVLNYRLFAPYPTFEEFTYYKAGVELEKRFFYNQRRIQDPRPCFEMPQSSTNQPTTGATLKKSGSDISQSQSGVVLNKESGHSQGI